METKDLIVAVIKKLTDSAKLTAGSQEALHLRQLLTAMQVAEPKESGPALLELFGKPTLELNEVLNTISDKLGLKNIDLKIVPRELIIGAIEGLCNSLAANEFTNLKVYLRHPSLSRGILEIYLKGKNANAEKDETPLGNILAALAKAFGVEALDLSKDVHTEEDVDEVVGAVKKETSKSKDEERAATRARVKSGQRMTTLITSGVALLLIIAAIVVISMKGGFSSGIGGFGENLDKPAVAAPVIDLGGNSSAAQIQVYDPATGNGLLADPASPHTRRDDGGGAGLFTDKTMYPEFQTGPVLERNTPYQVVILPNLPGVVGVSVNGGNYFAPANAFINTGQAPVTVSASNYPGLAALVAQTSGNQNAIAAFKFNVWTDFGLITTGFFVLYLLGRLAEFRLYKASGILKFAALLATFGGVMYIQSRTVTLNDETISWVLLGIGVLVSLISAIKLVVVQIGLIFEKVSDAKIPAVMDAVVPTKKDSKWEFIKKVMEFSDFDILTTLLLFGGLVNPDWSPLFVIFGLSGAVAVSGGMQFISGYLEMATRDTATDQDEDKTLFQLSIIGPVIATMLIGTNLGQYLPELIPGMAPIGNVLMAAIVILGFIVYGIIAKNAWANLTNDDRIPDFISWTCSNMIVGMAFLLIIGSLSLWMKVAVIAVVVGILVYLLVAVARDQIKLSKSQPAAE